MFNKVTILGIGLLGGSLARDLREKKMANTIVGVCRSEETANYALQHQLVDQVQPLTEAVHGADLIVLATPMQWMLPVLLEAREKIPAGAILTDVGSVKTDLYEQLRAQCPALLKQFVLAHPIAGGENAGIAASRSDLFNNKHLIITQTDEVPAEMVSVVSLMWRTLGAKVLEMSLQEHDAVFAKTSHLPHVVAFSLVNYLRAQADEGRLFDLAAAGFYDFTRIASSNAEMWRDICITNRTELLVALDGFHDQIAQIRAKIAASDQQAILEDFAAAKQARDSGLSNKGLNSKP